MKKYVIPAAIVVQFHTTYASHDVVDQSNNTDELVMSSNTNISSPVYAFDRHSLFGGSSQSIDLSYYTSKNRVIAGEYSLDVHVNERFIGTQFLKFDHLDANQDATLCITQDLLNKLDLKDEVYKKLPLKDCVTIKNLSKDAYYDLDRSSLKLNISLPLSITNNRPRGYINPELFDKGISSAFVKYDLNSYSHIDNDENHTSNYISLNAGVNFAGFNYRHSGGFESEGSKLGQYSSSLNTLSTDILPLESRLTAGDFYTNNFNLDSVQLRGLQLTTDLSMRPSSQRSYAPIIKGIANTNALVSVLQNGRKIYERSVPSGEFEINDLTAVSSNGNLTVEVIETGGEKYSYIIPLQSNNNLIRQGQFNYSIASGRYRLNTKTTDEHVSQLSFEYGLFNSLSVYTGTNLHQSYQSYLMGVANNSIVGGLKADVELSNADLANKKIEGVKYRANYQYNYLPTKTYLNLQSSYHSKNAMSLNSALSFLNYKDLSPLELNYFTDSYQLKNSTHISVNQSLYEGFGTLHLGASNLNYRNATKSTKQYQFGYSNKWGKLNYSLNISRTANNSSFSSSENRYLLSLTMPLDWSRKHTNVSSSIHHTDGDYKVTNSTLGVSGSLGVQNQASYGLSINNSKNAQHENSSISANAGYNFPKFHITTNVGMNDHSKQYGYSLRGALVGHRHGITATNNLSDTYTIVHAKGATGVTLHNGFGVGIDRFGNAVYSTLTPYEHNSVSLDIRNLDVDVNLKSNQSTIIPRRFSSTLVEFETQKSSNILFDVDTHTEHFIPIGAKAVDLQNNVVGLFGQSNQLFIETPDLFLKDKIRVQWGENNLQSCQIDVPDQTKLVKKTSNKGFNIIRVECL